ncbi:GNAT family N-acetyltransferase [Burkholderia cepacia]|nr:GNAT family N-acetyltransferase [Burkholderia cepacia]MCA7930343.1 GNAT family N-acetyltransferase [Burkholderia cepacia]
MKHERIDYRTGILSSPAEVPADEWNALLARDAQPTPFLRHEFLDALHVARCAVDDTGWSPHFVTLTDERTGRLAAAAPVYAKQHSYGEYVFDWAWADAYQRNDLPYYPKLLCAVPFTPVQGTRLLAADDDARRRLAATLLAFAEQSDVSSLHVLFPTGDEAALLESMGMMLREGVQFHWINDGYRHFDDFLGTLEQKKRKNIRAERRKVHEAGVTFRRLTGDRITDADWRFFSRCYRQTYREHYSSPYLNLDFFRTIGATMPENLLLVIAEAGGQPIASALAVYRRGENGGGTLYGRYWGAVEHVPCLHFETAYYQLLDFCIEAGLDTFEGGAQGEHKLARGFLPTVTHSAHWLAHPAFSDAVARFLERETEHIHAYVDELREHDPFRRGAGT